MEYKIIPAILTDAIEDFESQVSLIENVADAVQLDYVDGFFAPELTCCEARLIQEVEVIPELEVHLMVQEPIDQVQAWYKANADRLIGHIEEMSDQVEFVEAVSDLGLEVGLALNLETPLDDLETELVDGLDVVLLMGHKIGVQKEPFQKRTLDKIRQLRELHPNINIEVDGGVNETNILDIKQAGANIFAVGSGIFGSGEPTEAFKKLITLVSK